MRKLTSKGGFGLAVALCLVGCQKEGLTFLDSGISPGTGGTSVAGSQGGASGLATGGANGHGGSAGGVGGVLGTGGQFALGGSIGSGGNAGATGGRDASVDAGCPAGWTLCCGQCLSPQAGICSMPCSATGGAISTGGATSSGGVGAGSGGSKTGSGGATSSGGAGSGGSKTGSGGAKTGGAGGNSGGTGGASHYDGGQPADGGVSCTDLENAYAAALPAARSCDVAALAQCQQSVSSSLSPCFVNCMTYVNDASTLNKLKLEWQQGGCNSVIGIVCPAVACIAPTAGVCTATDGGGGVCTGQSLGTTGTL